MAHYWQLLVCAMLLCLGQPIKKQMGHDALIVSANEEIERLSQSRLGKLFFDLAELTSRTRGPVENLVEGVKAFGRQIEGRLGLENELFEGIFAEHNSKVIFLQSLVNQAELDLSREKKRVNQEFIPRTAELDDILLTLKSKREMNKEQVQDALATREQQHAHFVMTTDEFAQALIGIEQASTLVEDAFRSGEAKAAFVEISSERKHDITHAFKQIAARIEKLGHESASFISAMIQLSESQNFKDRQVMKQMTDFLFGLRSNIQSAMQKAYADEDSRNTQHEYRLKQLDEECAVFEAQYAEAYQEREDLSVRIGDTEAFISTRQSDHQAYLDRLRMENNNFATNQKIHDDLVQSIGEELAVLEKVLDLVVTPPFLDYLSGRMSK